MPDVKTCLSRLALQPVFNVIMLNPSFSFFPGYFRSNERRGLFSLEYTNKRLCCSAELSPHVVVKILGQISLGFTFCSFGKGLVYNHDIPFLLGCFYSGSNDCYGWTSSHGVFTIYCALIKILGRR